MKVKFPPHWLMYLCMGFLYLCGVVNLLFSYEAEWLAIVGVSVLGVFEITWWWVNRRNPWFYAMIGVVVILAFITAMAVILLE